MGRRLAIEQLVSAGGVVYRACDNGVEIALCGRCSPPFWVLPKGTPAPGETREQTARREVREETGLEVKTEGFIDGIQYWFVRPSDRLRCHKTVLFYLMSAIGGHTSRHDREFDEVRWFLAGDALKTMTYGNEAKVVQKGLAMASR